MRRFALVICLLVPILAVGSRTGRVDVALAAPSAPNFVDNGAPDGKMAMATRPSSSGKVENEAADDFVLPADSTLTGATFTGLLPSGASASSVQEVIVEIYRVFPKDSNASRTITVPTRANSPSDVDFGSRDSASSSQLTFTANIINTSFAVQNSVLNGIHPSPNQTTGGDGAVSGEEVRFTVAFRVPFSLPADHYFFVPQVKLSTGDFYWLSAPIPNPATVPDLQSWIRNSSLDPDWLRVGTDIVGGSTPPKFNASFSLQGYQTIFDNGPATNSMAMATRPGGSGTIEIEAADDFVLSSEALIDGASFTGLIPSGASVSEVVVEIYRVFPQDSDTTRTITVPTRTNSPGDVDFGGRDSSAGTLSFSTDVLASSFTAANSVLNGIHPSPNQTTGGEGAVSGQETQFNVLFATPFDLPAGHYFFVPQVNLTSGNFFWLSSPRPNPAFTPDLQAWIRNANLVPDWLRVGTDIVGGSPAPTFNASFSLEGTYEVTVPLLPTWQLIGGWPVPQLSDSLQNWSYSATTGTWSHPAGSLPIGIGAWEDLTSSGNHTITALRCPGPITVATQQFRFNMLSNPCTSPVMLPSGTEALLWTGTNYQLTTSIPPGWAGWFKALGPTTTLTPTA